MVLGIIGFILVILFICLFHNYVEDFPIFYTLIGLSFCLVMLVNTIQNEIMPFICKAFQ